MVERKHRHVVDLDLTLLSQSSLSISYWDFAFSTIVYLINRLPSSSINFQLSYILLFKLKLYYTFLKVFSYACFSLRMPYNIHQIDFKSQECRFLYYSTSNKGYKYLSSSDMLYISKDVLLNVSRFSYLDLFPKSTIGHSSMKEFTMPHLCFNP